MNKKIKAIVLIMLLAVIAYGLSYVWRALPIISGYGTKNLCSCVFVAGRTAASGIENELGNFPLSLGSFEVNFADSSVTGAVFGLAAKKAIYRKGLGCTLLSEISESEIRGAISFIEPILAPVDTLLWPFGHQMPDRVNEDINYEALTTAVNKAFEESDVEKPKNTRGIVVIYDGDLIMEKYADGFDYNTPQMGWSMTKSMTNAMIALLVKDGKLDIYQPAPVEQWRGEEDLRSVITIDQLLRMSSGLHWEEEYAGPSTATNMLFKKADMGQFAASFPLVNEPGSEWYYSSGTSNILSGIVREAVGEDRYYQFVRERLLSKLKMSSAVIEPDASGTFVGSSYMYATPRDWAKFGLLYLNDGVWDGERILPEGWASYSSTPTPGAINGEYGAHFWLNAGVKNNPESRWYPDAPTDMYSMNGYEGQRVFIIPSKKAVIVRLGLSKRGDFDFNEFLKQTLAALP